MNNPHRLSRISLTKKYCKKVYFGTKKDADEYLIKLAKESIREKVPVRSYLCHKCNCWHLTSWIAADLFKLVEEYNREVDKTNQEVVEFYQIHEEVVMRLMNQIVELNRENKRLIRERTEWQSKIK